MGCCAKLCGLEECAVRLEDLLEKVGSVCILGVLHWFGVGERGIFCVGIDNVLG